MSSKIALIISMVFFALFFLLSIDVMCIQYQLNNLDTISIPIGYEISKEETLNDKFISSLEDKYQINIISISPQAPEFGEVVTYIISKTYQPFIVSKEPMVLKIQRSTVIGYY